MGFLGGDKLIVGYDLGNEFSQISFAVSEEGEAETFSQAAGMQNYNIPTVLCKRYGVNQWFYGREALRSAEEGEGVLVENLLGMALDGEPVLIDGESYEPGALLALFFKRSLGAFCQASVQAKRPDKITALMVTCPVLDRSLAGMLEAVAEGIRIRADKICFQSYAESFYTYMLRQPGELRVHPPILFHCLADRIRVYRMEWNRRTTPVVVYMEESEYEFSGKTEPEGGEDMPPEALDAAFCRIAEDACGQHAAGNVYLIGDGFGGDWMQKSLRFLCRGRRVFQGNNLFSKGACCGMQERLSAGAAGKGHVFLGEDKLKANVGMKVCRQGEDCYYALLDAGASWYEAEQTVEFYLMDGNEITLTVTPLIRNTETAEKGRREARIALEGLPGFIARIRLRLFLEGDGRLTAEAEDLGFGEFREASGHVWRETVELY